MPVDKRKGHIVQSVRYSETSSSIICRRPTLISYEMKTTTFSRRRRRRRLEREKDRKSWKPNRIRRGFFKWSFLVESRRLWSIEKQFKDLVNFCGPRCRFQFKKKNNLTIISNWNFFGYDLSFDLLLHLFDWIGWPAGTNKSSRHFSCFL